MSNRSNANAQRQSTSIPASAAALGFSGLIPFLIPATGLWVVGSSYQFELAAALVSYGAVILSFLGGIRWGEAITRNSLQPGWTALILSVIPSLIGWLALLLHFMVNQTLALVLLAVGFIFQYLLDRRATGKGDLPPWFGRLRLYLSCGAVLSLIIGAVKLTLA